MDRAVEGAVRSPIGPLGRFLCPGGHGARPPGGAPRARRLDAGRARRVRGGRSAPRARPVVRAAPRRVPAADGRLAEAVVAVTAPVEDGHALVLGVDEDEEAVAELLPAAERVLLEHRLDGET